MKQACGIAALLASVAFPATAATRTARVASITDGDTFRTTSGERIRIANADAPETRRDQAKCASEIQQGKAATAQLRSLIGGREVSLDLVGVSYGRTAVSSSKSSMAEQCSAMITSAMPIVAAASAIHAIANKNIDARAPNHVD